MTDPKSIAPTAGEVLQMHADAMLAVASRLANKVDSLTHDNDNLRCQLGDALDGIAELKNALRGKDQIIEELQELLNRKRPKR